MLPASPPPPHAEHGWPPPAVATVRPAANNNPLVLTPPGPTPMQPAAHGEPQRQPRHHQGGLCQLAGAQQRRAGARINRLCGGRAGPAGQDGAGGLRARPCSACFAAVGASRPSCRPSCRPLTLSRPSPSTALLPMYFVRACGPHSWPCTSSFLSLPCRPQAPSPLPAPALVSSLRLALPSMPNACSPCASPHMSQPLSCWTHAPCPRHGHRPNQIHRPLKSIACRTCLLVAIHRARASRPAAQAPMPSACTQKPFDPSLI